MPEIFGNRKNRHSHIKEIVDLEDSGQFKSFLGSFMVTPKGTRFESQDDDEVIMIMGRRHFITNLKWIAMACFAFFVPFFWSEFPMVKVLDDNTSFTLSIVWYSALLFYIIQNFLLWFYNVYIVTNERLIDVDFFGLLYKNINVTHLSNIADVNYSQRGLLSSFFNYGDVIAQTSSEQKSDDGSEQSAFTFKDVSNPDLVVKIVSELMEEDEKNRN